MIDLPTIRRIATEVRAGCERIAPTLGYLDTAALTLFCAFASTAVTAALREAGVDAELAGGRCCGIGHFWCEVKVGLGQWDFITVDLTARQFDDRLDGVMVLEPTDLRRTGLYDRTTRPASLTSMPTQDRDLLRLLPPRWWTLDTYAPELLDARVRTALHEQPELSLEEVAVHVHATMAELLAAMSRLALRRPVYEVAA